MKLKSAMGDMLTYAVGIFLIKGISLLMLPVMAQYLEPAQLGKLELLATVSAFLGMLISVALHEALYRFAGEKASHEEQKRIASQLFSLTLTISFLMIAALIGFILFIDDLDGWISPLSSSELFVVIASLSLEGAIGVAMAWIRMQNKARHFLLISIATTTLQVSLILGVLFTGPSVVRILLASTVAHFVQFLLIQGTQRLNFSLPKLQYSSRYLNYCFPLMLSGLLAFGLNGAERWLILYATNLEQLGLYAIAAKFTLAMCILVQPFGMWWMPKRFHVIEQQGPKQAAIYTQYGIVLIAALAVCIAFFGQAFIIIALPESYIFSGKILVATLSIAVFKELTELFNIGILAEKNTQTLLRINMLCTFVGLPLAYTLNSFGIWGILMAVFLVQVSRMVIVTVVSQRLHQLPYDFKSMLILLVVCILLFFIASYALTVLALILMSVLAPMIVIFCALKLKLVTLPSRVVNSAFMSELFSKLHSLRKA
ncbi:oligosaccharide flippase family protein [Vibrio clamense]|uniref:lipopolysaccharide biosynthesis protein n=1 Tax=Vibrio clamense TaxID=2910254 RepID=UPI003D1F376B